jgi:Ca2+-binding RTX toxin-like protein
MRRASVFLVAASLLLALSAGVALARTLIGDGDPNIIVGTDRADFIDGKGDDDQLFGKDGRDTILGRGGNDVIVGGRGPDRLVGGYGDDTIYGGGGNDAVNGGPDDDIIVVSDDGTGPNSADQYACGGGEDTVYARSADHSTLQDEQNCEHRLNPKDAPPTPPTPDLEPGVYPVP